MFKEKTLKQRYKLFWRREFKLIGNKQIEVYKHSPLSSEIRTFMLNDINPLSMRHKDVDKKSFKYFCYIFFISLLCFLFSISLSPKSSSELIMTGILFFMLSLVCLLAAFLNSIDMIIFFPLHSPVSILEIVPNKPSKTTVDDFINELTRRINSIKYPDNITKTQLNEQYIRHLDFLCDQMVITEEEHASIVARLHEKAKESNVVSLNVH